MMVAAAIAGSGGLSISGNTLNVRVLDGSTPVHGATVKLTPMSGSSDGTYVKHTDASGYARFTGLGEGTYRVTAATGDKSTAGVAVVGGISTITLNLQGTTVPGGDYSTTVKGYVLSQADGVRLAGATVHFAGSQASTDANGAYAITKTLSPGDYDLYATYESYTSKTVTITVAENSAMTYTNNLAIEDVITADVHFIITDGATGTAPDSATVTMAGTTQRATAGDAWFHDIEVGTYAFSVSSEGYKTYSASVIMAPNGVTVPVELQKVAGVQSAWVQGTISVAGTDTPIQGATITLTPAGGTGSYTAVTDAHGDYVMSVPVGTYTATATADGFTAASYDGTFTLSNGQTANINLGLSSTNSDMQGDDYGAPSAWANATLTSWFIVGGILAVSLVFLYIGLRRQ